MRKLLLDKRPASRLVVIAAVTLVMMFLMAAKPADVQAQATGVHHIVLPGQYLAQIARIYGTTTQAILAANPQITNPNVIYAGQTIFVPFGFAPAPPPPPQQPPPPPPVPACRAWHFVTPGQTLLQISRWYGVSPFAIAQANGIYNLNLIYAGTTLCIP